MGLTGESFLATFLSVSRGTNLYYLSLFANRAQKQKQGLKLFERVFVRLRKGK